MDSSDILLFSYNSLLLCASRGLFDLFLVLEWLLGGLK